SPPALALDLQRFVELGSGERAAVDEDATKGAPRLGRGRLGRRGGGLRLGLGILEAEASLLDQDPRQLRAGERAGGDEELAELAARPLLLRERGLELASDDEPAL